MEVLALISGMQKGKTASLPSWISLRDIQQHKTRWKCFVPKCLCVLSSYPLFQTFRTFLAQLYRLSMSALTHSAMEAFVFNLLAEIPLPGSNHAQTSFSLIDKGCLLTGCVPGMPAFYPTEVDFTLLFQCLSPENVLRVRSFCGDACCWFVMRTDNSSAIPLGLRAATDREEACRVLGEPLCDHAGDGDVPSSASPARVPSGVHPGAAAGTIDPLLSITPVSSCHPLSTLSDHC